MLKQIQLTDNQLEEFIDLIKILLKTKEVSYKIDVGDSSTTYAYQITIDIGRKIIVEYFDGVTEACVTGCAILKSARLIDPKISIWDELHGDSLLTAMDSSLWELGDILSERSKDKCYVRDTFEGIKCAIEDGETK